MAYKDLEKEVVWRKHYREENKEKIAASLRCYQEENKEAIIASKKHYKEENPEVVAAWSKKRIKNLNNALVNSMLNHQHKVVGIKFSKQVIECKRIEILAKRKIKKLSN